MRQKVGRVLIQDRCLGGPVHFRVVYMDLLPPARTVAPSAALACAVPLPTPCRARAVGGAWNAAGFQKHASLGPTRPIRGAVQGRQQPHCSEHSVLCHLAMLDGIAMLDYEAATRSP